MDGGSADGARKVSPGRKSLSVGWLGRSGRGAMGDVEGGRVLEGLGDDAVAVDELDEFGDLVVWRIGLELENEADGGESDGRGAIDAEGAAEIEVRFGEEFSAAQWDAHGERHGLERDAGAGDERLQKHVAGTGG